MLSTSIEDYIKAIFALEAEGRPATTKKIAQRLGVKMASVTGMIKHLAAEGYVRHTPYRGALMTDKGRTVAIEMVRRHRLIELFLAQTLGLSWDEVDADAEVLEHAVSDRLIERIYDFLGRPEFAPHGSPIPGRDGSFPDQNAGHGAGTSPVQRAHHAEGGHGLGGHRQRGRPPHPHQHRETPPGQGPPPGLRRSPSRTAARQRPDGP